MTNTVISAAQWLRQTPDKDLVEMITWSTSRIMFLRQDAASAMGVVKARYEMMIADEQEVIQDCQDEQRRRAGKSAEESE